MSNLRKNRSDSPKVYVGTYAKYNNGSLKGEWLELSGFRGRDEFLKACRKLHSDEEDPELMFQDFENFPRSYYSESNIRDDLWYWLELTDDEKDVLEAYLEVADSDATSEDAQDAFMGIYDSKEDWATELIEKTGGPTESLSSYAFLTEVDAHLVAMDEADSILDSLDDEEVIEKTGKEEEYEGASEAKQHLLIILAREELSEQITNEVERKIKDDPVGYFVDEQGIYTLADFMKCNFVSIDYERIARDEELNGAVSFIKKDGKVFVFRN